ncbi:hypothetical protein AVEN_12277-1 [Araneus ventricosus]|uniref:Uncharacterized protein n=1 Tax=Araneus ventricosus TaxID=182803 RepID=A0A4Y2HCJ4_ARAVE|nr:hypothetical protein AVEN_12277-1 [Araneus ventricosus]
MVFTPSSDFNQSEGWETDLEELLRKEGCFHPIDGDYPTRLQHLSDTDNLEIEDLLPLDLLLSHLPPSIESERAHYEKLSPLCLLLDFHGQLKFPRIFRTWDAP